ncbi:maleylpyruvate isomerase family mycothiol-dependent enzyme [Nonomuraea sp. NPDC050310]|uniref:maleylpyruvate isomerase family mycothiol-dependent enzyme n=1 Tax=Nonomuraea sp. NPDC050310 TaxID=3154935 RepID=UPI0034039F4E
MSRESLQPFDRVDLFRQEAEAFTAAARRALPDAPQVPSCPDWSVADLVLHLAGVHRTVARLIEQRMDTLPDPSTMAGQLPRDLAGWPDPAKAPSYGPMPESLLEWFGEGARRLAEVFRTTDPATEVWTYGADRTVAFWVRVQTIEVALHRWDAELAVGTPGAIDPALAADAVAQTFEVMVPFRRAMTQAPPGAGETYRFRRTDGPESWTVRFDGPDLHVHGTGADAGEGVDVELAGTAEQLMLHLWHRTPANTLAVTGDRTVLERYFTLAPPV